MNTKTSLFVIISILSLSCSQLKAQSQSTQTSQNTLPNWVNMIDNPNTNYYEALKAFDEYWKGKIKPKGDTQMMKEREQGIVNTRLRDSLALLTTEQISEYDLIRYHYKRFKNWAHEVKPFVQENGRVLSMNERIAIWEQQQKEIKQQKK